MFDLTRPNFELNAAKFGCIVERIGKYSVLAHLIRTVGERGLRRASDSSVAGENARRC